MKQMKSIFAVVLMSMMFANVAFAQAPKNNQSNNVPTPAQLTTEETAAIRAALASTPAASMGMLSADSTYFVELLDANNEPIATHVAEAGSLCGTMVEAGDSVRLYVVRTQTGFNLFCDVVRPVAKQVHVVDNSAVLALDTAAINSQFIEKQHEGRPRYKTIYQADQHLISNGEIVRKAQDKYGLSVLAGGVGQFGSDLNAFSGELGFSYSIGSRSGRIFLMPEVTASVRRTKYNANANDAGKKYWSYGTEATLFGGLALGKHGDHRIALGAGLGWEFYSTDSKARYYDDGSWDELKSKGNYLYPEFKLRYEWDGYNKPISLFTGIGTRLHKSVWQNEVSQKNWLFTVEIGVKVKLFRHVTNNK